MKKNIQIWRDKNGIPHVESDNVTDLFYGQGYVHATDRGMQILLMRILGKGRVAEILDPSNDSVEIDKFFRKMNWAGNLSEQVNQLERKEKEYLFSYCDGINEVFSRKIPWEYKLMGYKPEKWIPEDCLMISRMIGYLTLAQSQSEMERLFVELVQANVSKEKLDELFPNILGELDIDLLKKVTLNDRIVPSKLWGKAIPRMMASNNWVISGSKTVSGRPIVANDPHLEVNRLPNVWCEVVLKSKDRFLLGGSMPGFPGVLTGRNNNVAWGVTYAFVDAVDSWVEECQEGKYLREDKWLDFTQRKEIIKQKKKKDTEIIFYENNHGVLDGNPFEEGYYLTTKWAASESGAISLSAVLKMWDCKTVEEGMNTFGKTETGWSFVFADSNDDIGFQMSGNVPKRRKGISGFVPLPGWKKENDWQGLLDIKELPRCINPEQGFFATSNHNLNYLGTANPINMPMGSYRVDRINDILKNGNKFTIDDTFKMHFDVYSLQAEYFMKILKPLLPDTEQGKILRNWDLKYTLDSKGAFLFEEIYRELYKEVFGKNGFNETVIDYLGNETGTFIDFYDNFDKILLKDKSVWFGEKTRDELYKKVIHRTIDVTPKKWGTVHKFTMTNILLGEKTPNFMGFNKGPIEVIGGRATIHQGQIYQSAGRTTTFFPSYRTVTEIGNDDFYSVLAGGPSDRRFSKWYCSDLKNWISGKYKIVSQDKNSEKKPFK